MVNCYRKNVTVSDLWVSSHDKLSDFYASSWQRGDSAVPLLVVRILLAALAVGILVWSLCEAPNPYWLIYLTNWGLLLVVTMMLSGLLVSFMAVCKKLPDVGELPWYVSMYWLFYNLAISIAIMITALYWILLYDPGDSNDVGSRMFWLDVATHAINSGIALAELLVSRTPVYILHIFQPLGVGLWYAAFTAVYYAAGGTDANGFPFIYEVLDWRQGLRAGAIVATSTLGLFVIYLVLWGVALCRDKLSTATIRTTSHDLPFTPPDTHMPTLPV